MTAAWGVWRLGRHTQLPGIWQESKVTNSREGARDSIASGLGEPFPGASAADT